jgi:hypothetical protein
MLHPRRRYPYFDVVAGLAWSNGPESYVGGSIATGRGSHAGQMMTQIPWSSGLGIGSGADNPTL